MRLRFYVPLALALAVPATAHADVPGYRAAVMADGPIAYWHLDEAAGTTAVDFAGDHHDGTYGGGFTLSQAAPFGGAGNSAVRLGADGTITADVPGTTKTVELWVRPSLRTQQTFIRFGDPAAGGWSLGLNGPSATPRNAKRKLVFTTHGQVTNSKVPLAANAWSLIAVSWASGNTLKFSVNGGAFYKVAHPAQYPDADSTVRRLVVGPGAGAAGTSFDEVALFPANIDERAHFVATGLPVLNSPPTLSPLTGVKVGDTLTLSPGSWAGGTTVADTWQRCDSIGACQAIAGASGTTYMLQTADAGYTIRVQEVGANATGAVTVYTDDTDPVANADGTQPTVPPVLPPGTDPSVPPQESEAALAAEAHSPSSGGNPTSGVYGAACSARVNPVRARRLRLRGAGRAVVRFDARSRRASVSARRRALRAVTWTIDGRRLRGQRRSPFRAVVPLARLAPGHHVLRARLRPRHGRARTVTLRIVTAC